MEWLLIILWVLSGLAVLMTLTPLLKWDVWWVRVFDFPRLQIAALQLTLLVAMLFFADDSTLQWWYILWLMLAAGSVYQMLKIFRYTPLAPVQVKKFRGSAGDNAIALLVSNVLSSNRKSDLLLQAIRRENPDLVLTLESDQWWENQLSVLQNEYPHCVEVPLENRYGMHLYSKLELENPTVKFLLEEDVPSIHTRVKLRSGRSVRMHCLHPKPPSPTESKSATNRDAELLIVAREVEGREESILVFGDLNDVAWSYTTRLFQKISNLLDPRIGRGFFNTFNANHLLLRWPLDHIFHSSDFALIDIRRLEHIGSDHFPIYAKLCYHPDVESRHDEPDADREEEREAAEKMAKAK